MEKDLDFDGYKRREERKEYEAEVYFSIFKRAYMATIKNISRGGALVHTGGMPRIYTGDRIIITIPYTDGAKSVKRNAEVMWVDSECMGVRFI